MNAVLHTISLSQAASNAVQTISLTKKESDPVTTVSLTPSAKPRAVRAARKEARRKGRK